MANYPTISALVDQISADTWDVLREIKERRPAMMLLELIDCRRRASKNRSRLNHDRTLRTHMKRPRCDHVESIGELGADMALSVPRTLPAETSLPIIQLLRRATPRAIFRALDHGLMRKDESAQKSRLDEIAPRLAGGAINT